jgi:hypothetical protein
MIHQSTGLPSSSRHEIAFVVPVFTLKETVLENSFFPLSIGTDENIKKII